jgi:lambda repressor-like predicted transcriptional regulator
VNKIIKLSTVLEPPYKPDEKMVADEKDIHGRNIIKNKYRILDNTYLNVYNE